MRDPNLYYFKNGQRQCKKCKHALAKEYRKAHKERLKKQRQERIRKEKSLRVKIKRREKTGGVRVEGADV